MTRPAHQFLTFVRKEFYHAMRDRKTLLILFGLPVVQIIIFGFALTNEVKNARVVIVDHARDEMSTRLVTRVSASRYFDLADAPAASAEIEEEFKSGNAKLASSSPQDSVMISFILTVQRFRLLPTRRIRIRRIR